MRRRNDFPSLPFPFNVIPYLVMGMWLVMVAALIVGVYWVIAGSWTPEQVGEFFGRVVGGFEEGRQ